MTTTYAEFPAAWIDMLTKVPEPPKARPKRTTPIGADIFTAYNNHADLAYMLTRDGADVGRVIQARPRLGRPGGPYSAVVRPGKDKGRSATLWYGQGGSPDRLWVFTTDWPNLPASEDADGHGYSAFDYLKLVKCGGDARAARAEAVRVTGWTENAPPKPPPADQTPPVDEPQEERTSEEHDAEMAEVLKMANLVNWDRLANGETEVEDWLVRPLIPRGRAVALVASAGVGKSLLTLYISACLATGRKLFGETLPRTKVLYGDWENTEQDIQERLESMGFDVAELNGWLHLASFAEFGPLNHKIGGDRLVMLAKHLGVELVVIDTFGRVIDGKENDADPFREFYAVCGMRLKQAGIAQARLDHASFKADKKEGPKSARGSSEKSGDVDIVWIMSKSDSGYTLTCDQMKGGKRRIRWAPYVVDIVLDDEDGETNFRLKPGSESSWLPGVAAKAAELDGLGLPSDVSRRKAQQALRDAGLEPGNAQVLGQALKFRRQNTGPFVNTGRHGMPQNQSGAGTTAGTTQNHPPRNDVSAGKSAASGSGTTSAPVSEPVVVTRSGTTGATQPHDTLVDPPIADPVDPDDKWAEWNTL